MITYNEVGRYYKVLINEYPKYEGEIFTKIDNNQIFFSIIFLFLIKNHSLFNIN